VNGPSKPRSHGRRDPEDGIDQEEENMLRSRKIGPIKDWDSLYLFLFRESEKPPSSGNNSPFSSPMIDLQWGAKTLPPSSSRLWLFSLFPILRVVSTSTASG
jgi:hypothetical protein